MERAEAEAVYDAGRDACVQFILDLAARVDEHDERLRRLEEQERRDSRTSSVPPSTDPPKTRQQRRAQARAKAKELAREGARRRAGGQDGHPGAGRRLEPEDRVDEIVEHYPDACRGCGREFGADELQPVGRFGRRQIVELPPISVLLLVEHRTRRLRCPDCRVQTTARLPVGVGDSVFGPRLRAAIVTLTARNRISRRAASELARELFGVGLSVGSVDAICQHASDVLAGPYQQLRAWILGRDTLHIDETGWRTAGDSRALWTMTTAGGSLFEIAEHGNREQFDELIGAFCGVVVSDRWPGYEHLDPRRRQVCWSHRQRDFRRHSEGLAEQKTFGEHGLKLTGRVFAAWRAYQHDHDHDRARLQADLQPIQTELRALLEAAGRKHKRTRLHRRFANNLLKVWPALWTFATHPDLEPTNNPAERALRGPVIHPNSRTAPAPTTANGSPNAPSPPPRPAANNDARCSTSSPNCSAPTPTATPSQRPSEPRTERLHFSAFSTRASG